MGCSPGYQGFDPQPSTVALFCGSLFVFCYSQHVESPLVLNKYFLRIIGPRTALGKKDEEVVLEKLQPEFAVTTRCSLCAFGVQQVVCQVCQSGVFFKLFFV